MTKWQKKNEHKFNGDHCPIYRMPLQYILGDWDFHSIKLNIRPPVFIPRQETEGLVNICSMVLKDIENPLVLDVGCGSGAISLALLNNLPNVRPFLFIIFSFFKVHEK